MFKTFKNKILILFNKPTTTAKCQVIVFIKAISILL